MDSMNANATEFRCWPSPLRYPAGKSAAAPVVHALRGKEYIEYDNPFDVGMTGLLGFSSGYYAMMNRDTLLMIGANFPYQQFSPKDATVVQFDIRGEEIGRRMKVDLGLVGDTKPTLRALLPRLQQNHYKSHLQESLEQYRKARKGLVDLVTGDSGRTPIHPQYVARLLDQLAAEERFSPATWERQQSGQRVIS
jgi:pyruvate dehydrogenase (quinone)